MARWVWIGLAVVVALSIGGTAIWLGGRTGADRAAASVSLEPDNRVLTAEGRQIYADQCAACHGADLEGQPNWRSRGPDGRLPAPPHDPSGHTWHHPDEQLFALTKYGPERLVADPDYRSNMPGFEGALTDREIVAVLSYIKRMWPAEIQARHDEINRRTAAEKEG